jgi:hypothetical protein
MYCVFLRWNDRITKTTEDMSDALEDVSSRLKQDVDNVVATIKDKNKSEWGKTFDETLSSVKYLLLNAKRLNFLKEKRYLPQETVLPQNGNQPHTGTTPNTQGTTTGVTNRSSSAPTVTYLTANTASSHVSSPAPAPVHVYPTVYYDVDEKGKSFIALLVSSHFILQSLLSWSKKSTNTSKEQQR